jgi:hypothetical protein
MAALAIARRALINKKETIPKQYKECSSWKEVYETANKKK